MSDTTKVDATSTATTDTTKPDPELEGLGDKGKLTLIKIREERDAIRTAKEAAETKLAEYEKAEAKRIRDDEAAKEAKAVEDGQFKDLAEKRGNDLQTVTSERDTFKSQIDAYKAVISPVIEERLKAVQEADEETAKVFPKDADPLAQLDWLNSPLVRRVVDLMKQSETNQKYLAPRNTQTPKPNTNITPTDEEAKRAQARTYRDF